jgi:two-component system sensor histidine kinase UhpB
MKRSLLLCISFIVFLTVPLLHAAEANPSGQVTILQEILILNSYHPGFAWSDDEQAGIIDVFRAKEKNWLPVIEYLDLKRLPDGRHLAELKQLFRRKYQKKKFSVVIAMDNPALEFAINNQAELFRNAPIVFCGINNYTPSLLKGRSDVTGIAESIDIAETIEVMLRLHPAAREIFVPHDYTVSVLAVRKEIEALVPRFGAKVRFRFSDPLTMEELLKELERLPKDSLVLEIGFITDKSGRTFGMTEAVILFFEHSPVPVYSAYEQRLGFGIVGGKLLSPRTHGTNAARIALRVLAGEKASAIPVVLESDSQFMFDYKVMSHFGIPLSALPEGSTVINKPVSFYATHRVVIQTALGVIVFMAVVISLLTINIIQRRRSAIALRASEAKYYDLYENAPDMHFSVDVKTATITECNNTLVEAFGYSKEEILGLSIFEIHHPDGREEAKRVFQQFAATGEVHDVERMIRRKDGEIIYVSLNASAVRDKEGKITHSRSVWRDITERKEAENALRESEERLRFHTDNSPMAVVEWNTDFVVTRWTGAAEKMFGWSFEETIGKPIMELRMIYEEDIPIVQNVMQRLTDGKSKYIVSSNRNYTKTRKVIHCEWFNSVLYDSAGKMISVMSQVLDITERKQAEEALHKSEERFRSAFDHAPIGMALVGLDERLLQANSTLCAMLGYSSEALLAKTVPEITHPDDRELERRHKFRLLSEGGQSFQMEKRYICADGHIIWGQLSVSLLKDNMGNPLYYLGQLEDISERKRAEEELRASREQMRALAGRLQAVREEERTQIAREIHDELGGALTGLKIDFSLLTRAALKIGNETVRTSLLAGMDSMTKSIDATIQTVRRIAMELRPGVLDDLGLVAALEWQLKDFEKRTGIRCEFFPPVEEIDLDADLSTALFRIFQEALTNVARHSGATDVRVRLRADADSSTLEVEDNGKGIEKEKTLSSKSLGLLGMRERAQMFGGRITVAGTPGTDTKVTVDIPLVEKRKTDRDQEGAAG